LLEKVVAEGNFLQFYISNKAVTTLILPHILSRGVAYGRTILEYFLNIAEKHPELPDYFFYDREWILIAFIRLFQAIDAHSGPGNGYGRIKVEEVE
jgi:hypothetical protein